MIFDSDMWASTQEEKAEKARMSSSTWRKIVRDQWFAGVVTQRAVMAIDESLPRLMDAAIRSGTMLGKDGHYDRRMLFTMAGLSTSKPGPGAGGVHLHVHSERLSEALNRTEAAVQAAATIDGEYTELEPEPTADFP